MTITNSCPDAATVSRRPAAETNGLWQRALRCAAVTVALLMPIGAAAHAVGQSYLFLSVYDRSIEGTFEIAVADLNAALGLDLPTDGALTDEMLAPHTEAVHRYIARHATIAPDGQPIPLALGPLTVFDATFARFVLTDFKPAAVASPPERIDVEYTVLFDEKPGHSNLVVIENNWKTGTFNNEANVSLYLSADDPAQQIDLSDSSLWRGFVMVVEQGMHHIWIGIDHILFLVALLLPAVVRRDAHGWVPVERFRDALLYVVKIVTLFTVAHSITLSWAALGNLNLSPRIVESVIALSIAVAALDVIVPVFGRRIWLVVFVFGLFHGFGFASVLADLGMTREHKALTLAGFNIGVEIGQLAIVCVIFPLLYLARRAAAYRRVLLPAASSLLIAVAMYWFVERAFEIDLPAGEIVNNLLAALP